MDLRKILPIRSPLGLLLAAGVVAVATSPTARKKVREFAVKGTAAVLNIADQFKNRATPLKPKMETDTYDFDFSKWKGSVDFTKEADIKGNDHTNMMTASMNTELNLNLEKKSEDHHPVADTEQISSKEDESKKQFDPDLNVDLKSQDPQTSTIDLDDKKKD